MSEDMRKEEQEKLQSGQVDVVVIGGGILGCFAARSLMRWKLSVLLIEEKEDVCTGITRANSAIVYSGYDNKAGSLKAQMTVRANAGFAELCKELDVPFCRCGSLAVAQGPSAERVLQKKYQNGLKNGVPGLALLSGEEARTLEPHLSEDVTMALYAPSTGTVNPWKLGIAAYENACHNGCETWLNTVVTRITHAQQGYRVSYCMKDSQTCEQKIGEITCKAILNCAGLASDKIQEMMFPPSVRLTLDAAVYLVTDRKMDKPDHIIFQECEEKGKGITAVPTTDGNLLVASARCELGKAPFSVNTETLSELKDMTVGLLPKTDLSKVIRSFGAVRPNPQQVIAQKSEETGQIEYIPDGKSIGSFVIENPAFGFYSLIGIKTPGITCADELGKYLAEHVAADLKAEKNLAFDPCRRGITSLHELELKDRAAFIQEHPDYGTVICQCEDITKGEVLEAIRRGAVTVDGVKRRVGCGMGRCQGSRCQRKIQTLLDNAVDLETSRSEDSGQIQKTKYHVVVIGAGAAGISAARSAYESGCEDVLLIDCRKTIGGVLPQCTHRGFGQHLTGPEYIENLLVDFPKQITCWTETMVLSVSADKRMRISGERTGVQEIAFDQLILAAGCMEIPMGFLAVGGTRPNGIYTAGQVQEMMNLHMELPPDPVVILGSGDLGLILAEQLSQRGIRIAAMIEQKDACGGMAVNRERIQGYDIPLFCSSTLVQIHGDDQVQEVQVKNLRTGEICVVPCRSVLAAVGLRPDLSLVEHLFEKKEDGILKPEDLPDWIHVCGNCKEVHPMIEAVIKEGKQAGKDAAK